MRILIADDEPTSLMMMGRMLRQSGYEVSTACHGMEVVESVREDDGPRLLLLDWMMPQLSGPEVCQAIRTGAGKSYVYIILLTARDTKDDLVKGLEAGADDYLTKPCHPEELRARLRTGQRVLHLEDRLVEARNQMQVRATYDALTGGAESRGDPGAGGGAREGAGRVCGGDVRCGSLQTDQRHPRAPGGGRGAA